MKPLVLVVISVLLLDIVMADIMINEIFPNPVSDESLNEWIEIYNNGSLVDISGWIIGDEKDNDSLVGGLYGGLGTLIGAEEYAIITDSETRVYDNFNVSNAVKLYVDDNSIGNGLGNDGEKIYLYNPEENLVDSVEYDFVDEGKSYALINNTWFESRESIGYSNYGYYGCDWKVEILLNETEFDLDDFSWKLKASKIDGDATLLSARAMVKDNYGDIVKEYSPFTNYSASSKKSSSTYTPNLDPGIYFIYANLSTECDDFYLDNNFDDSFFFIKEKPREQESTISVEKIYDLGNDDEAAFGNMIRVKIIVYKGNTTKNTVKAWVENKDGDRASKQSKTNVYDNYYEHTLTIPIQLYPNCNEKLEDGTYYVKVEGLDVFDSEKIKVRGISSSLCKELVKKESLAKKNTDKKFEYEIIDYPIKVNVGEEFFVKVDLLNNDDEDYDINLWSYVYRGSKSYSGDKEGNKKKITLKKESTKIIELKNVIMGAESGDYKLKVKINKNNQKTDYEITKSINIENDKKKSLKKENNGINEKIILRKEILYEGSNYKVKKLISYIFIGALAMLSVLLVFKN